MPWGYGPTLIGSCGKKRRFKTHGKAYARAKAIYLDDGPLMRAYHCTFCNGFHLTRRMTEMQRPSYAPKTKESLLRTAPEPQPTTDPFQEAITFLDPFMKWHSLFGKNFVEQFFTNGNVRLDYMECVGYVLFSLTCLGRTINSKIEDADISHMKGYKAARRQAFRLAVESDSEFADYVIRCRIGRLTRAKPWSKDAAVRSALEAHYIQHIERPM